jgi:hypothetical protein
VNADRAAGGQTTAQGSSSDEVSFDRYFTELRISDQQRSKERMGWMITVGSVIWFFIERHLAALNHENERVALIAAATVSEDTYKSDKARTDDERDKLDVWRGEVDKKFTQAVTKDEVKDDVTINRRAKGASAWQWIGGIGGLILLIIVLMTIGFNLVHNLDGTKAPTVVCTATYHPAPCP